MFFGSFFYFHDFPPAAAATAAILIVPSLLTTNAIYRAWCTGAAILLLAASLEGWAPLTIAIAAAIVTVVFLVAPRIPRAYGYGAAIALIVIDAFPFLGWGFSPQAAYAGGLLAGIALVYTAHRLFGGAKAPLYTAVVSLILSPAPGVTAALLLIVIGYGRAAPVLTALGIAAGLAYFSHYYYALSLTLLLKSVVLMASGLVLLALRWFLIRRAS